MYRIIVYHPDSILLEKIKRLPEDKFRIVGTVDDDTEEILYQEYDYVCIPLDNYKATKHLLSKYIDISIVHTYEELRVLGSERNINEYYFEQWKACEERGIKPFDGKTVLIFGGGSGIGYACAEAFTLSGANVMIAGRNEKKLMDAVEKLGHNAKCVPWDITDVSAYGDMLEKALEMSSNDIEIVINSAGICDGETVSLFDVSEDVYDTVMDTNLKGAYFLSQCFARYFIEKRIAGHIVHVISEQGSYPTVKPYGMSKWGLWGLTKGLGLTLAKYNITVNGIAPGEVATDMTGWGSGSKGFEPARKGPQTGRVLFSREVADAILFLAGKTGENMPGEVILYDGGTVAGVYRLQLLNN